ncbi:hypothetical protein RMB13_08970 [Acinetobacter sp. V102_4]|uniref:DUF7940 domain-containing protein n=1 Tax=Acinetobacter sp. V102_4 TaxID=3072984 RepID=UPI00287C2D16|nr:hypothetical protein [Acinetobacter sp. V102_4]MDS7929609.1 hypothetical protein [Acinetobacter sp. V102_4]
MKKSQHKIPTSVIQARIKQQVEKELKDLPVSDEQVSLLRADLSKANSQLDQVSLELADKKQQLLDQAKRHQTRIDELKDQSAQQPQSLQAVHGSTIKLGFWVHNWQTGWMWFSNVAFAGIVTVQTFYDTLPAEVIMALPADTQSKITLTLAVLGLFGRFINQSKPKPLPPASDDFKEDA